VVGTASGDATLVTLTGERPSGTNQSRNILPDQSPHRMPLAVWASHAYTVGELTVEEKQ
jgi:hypothetical protein